MKIIRSAAVLNRALLWEELETLDGNSFNVIIPEKILSTILVPSVVVHLVGSYYCLL